MGQVETPPARVEGKMEPIAFRYTPGKDDYLRAMRVFMANDRKLWLVVDRKSVV
jgi:hypothetical protein